MRGVASGRGVLVTRLWKSDRKKEEGGPRFHGRSASCLKIDHGENDPRKHDNDRGKSFQHLFQPNPGINIWIC